jgi:hypothetical protein
MCQAYCHRRFGLSCPRYVSWTHPPQCWFGQQYGVHLLEEMPVCNHSNKRQRRQKKKPYGPWKRSRISFLLRRANQETRILVPKRLDLDSPFPEPSTGFVHLPVPAKVPETFIKFSKVCQRLRRLVVWSRRLGLLILCAFVLCSSPSQACLLFPCGVE